MPALPNPLIIWSLSDGKPGHDNQRRGLVQAIQQLTDATEFVLQFPTGQSAFKNARQHISDLNPEAPNHLPHLIIGVGHRTHLALLRYRRAYQAQSLVIMKPSLPSSLFDLCLIPQHDQPKVRPNIIPTRGAINTVQPTDRSAKRPNQSALLIGGPSRHHNFNLSQLLTEITAVITAHPEQTIQATSSRRTPAELTLALHELAEHHTSFNFTPFEETDPTWVPTVLAESSRAWVSEDSISMIYESLTANCHVGLLSMPIASPNKTPRVVQGVQQLITDHYVTPFEQWAANHELQAPPEQLNEAERCAKLVIRHMA